MTKVFYDHLILIDEIFIEIDSLDIPKTEKQQARQLVDEIFHHRVMTHLLNLLPNQRHEEFLKRFQAAPHDVRHLSFLQELITVDVSSDLLRLGEKIKKELRREFKKHHRKER